MAQRFDSPGRSVPREKTMEPIRRSRSRKSRSRCCASSKVDEGRVEGEVSPKKAQKPKPASSRIAREHSLRISPFRRLGERPLQVFLLRGGFGGLADLLARRAAAMGEKGADRDPVPS